MILKKIIMLNKYSIYLVPNSVLSYKNLYLGDKTFLWISLKIRNIIVKGLLWATLSVV